MECACNKSNNNFPLLEKVFEKNHGELNIITVLQQAQDIYGYLSDELILHIASKTGIKPAKVIGVATFYAQFRFKPAGKYMVQLCQGTACHVNGSGAIEEALLSFLSEQAPYKIGDTTPDGLFTLKSVACLGCCSLSPVMMINGETYGTLTPEKARVLLKDIGDREKMAGDDK